MVHSILAICNGVATNSPWPIANEIIVLERHRLYDKFCHNIAAVGKIAFAFIRHVHIRVLRQSQICLRFSPVNKVVSRFFRPV